jgi:hypothetical protein
LAEVQEQADAAGKIDWIASIDSAMRSDKHLRSYRAAVSLAATLVWFGAGLTSTS